MTHGKGRGQCSWTRAEAGTPAGMGGPSSGSVILTCLPRTLSSTCVLSVTSFPGFELLFSLRFLGGINSSAGDQNRPEFRDGGECNIMRASSLYPSGILLSGSAWFVLDDIQTSKSFGLLRTWLAFLILNVYYWEYLQSILWIINTKWKSTVIKYGRGVTVSSLVYTHHRMGYYELNKIVDSHWIFENTDLPFSSSPRSHSLPFQHHRTWCWMVLTSKTC